MNDNVIPLLRRIEELLPLAKQEWEAAGFTSNDFEALEAQQINRGYVQLQSRLNEMDGQLAFQSLMQAAGRCLTEADERRQKVEAAKDAFQDAAWQGHIHVKGRARRSCASTLSDIDRTYFRLERLIFCQLGDISEIAPIPMTTASMATMTLLRLKSITLHSSAGCEEPSGGNQRQSK